MQHNAQKQRLPLQLSDYMFYFFIVIHTARTTFQAVVLYMYNTASDQLGLNIMRAVV